MSPLPDLTPLLPTDDARRARRDALVTELRRAARPQAVHTPETSTPRPPARPATGRQLRRPPRSGIALVAIAVLTALGAATLPGLAGAPVDVGGEARAAARPVGGGVLHPVVQFDLEPKLGPVHVLTGAPPKGRVVGTLSGRTEHWSSDDPRRWRSVRFITVPGGREQATSQESYADGVLRAKDSWDPAVRERTLTADRQAPEERVDRSRLGAIDETGDPVPAIRRLLDDGALEADGETTIGGRSVRRLVGSASVGTRRDGRPESPTRFVYLVDADTFEPVRITATRNLPAQPDAEEPAARQARTTVLQWTFTTFERLPPDTRTEKLLVIDERG